MSLYEMFKLLSTVLMVLMTVCANYWYSSSAILQSRYQVDVAETEEALCVSVIS